MPKKRTLEPYYGKVSQGHDATASKAMRNGDIETANAHSTMAVMTHAKRAVIRGNPSFAERIVRRHEYAKGTRT